MVREQAFAVEEVALDGVLEFSRARAEDGRAVRRVWPRVELVVGVEGRQLSLFRRAEAHRRRCSVPDDRAGQLLLARVDDLDGPLDLLRQERRRRLRVKLLARAEAAADRRLDDAYFVFADADEFADYPALLKDGLGVAPDRELAPVAEVADAGGRFDRRMLHRRNVKTALDDDVRVFETLVGVALFDLALPDDVVFGKVRLKRFVSSFQRLVYREDRRQYGIFDDDFIAGLAACFGGLGGDAEYAVARALRFRREYLFIFKQQRRGRVARAVVEGVRHILRQERAHISGDGLRGAQIYFSDDGARVGTSDDGPIDHSRQLHVVGVDCAPSQLVPGLEPHHGMFDNGKIPLHHFVPPPILSAASFTAFSIFV